VDMTFWTLLGSLVSTAVIVGIAYGILKRDTGDNKEHIKELDKSKANKERVAAAEKEIGLLREQKVGYAALEPMLSILHYKIDLLLDASDIHIKEPEFQRFYSRYHQERSAQGEQREGG